MLMGNGVPADAPRRLSMARRRALFRSPDSRTWRTESARPLWRGGTPSAVKTIRFIYRIVPMRPEISPRRLSSRRTSKKSEPERLMFLGQLPINPLWTLISSRLVPFRPPSDGCVYHRLRADQGEAGLRLGLGWFWFFLSWKVFALMPDISAMPQADQREAGLGRIVHVDRQSPA